MNEHVDRLASELEAMKLTDEHALLSFLPLSARLAALGRPGQLQRAMDQMRRSPGFDRLLLDRCKEGVWDIRSALEEFLALAVIAAQDFACLRDLEQRSLTEAVCLAIQSWIDCAESASLDASAVNMLEVFLERFPIPESHRLGIVDSPFDQVEREILAEVASRVIPRATIEVELRPDPIRAEEFAFADAGEAPMLLMHGWSVAEKDLSAPGVGGFIYGQRLYSDWRVIIDINLPDGAELPATSVRLGPLAATRDVDSPGRWVLNLRDYPRSCRTRAIDEAVVVTFADGIRMKLL